MNFRSRLSLSASGIELRTVKGHRDGQREPLLVNRLEHLPLASKPASRKRRPVLIVNRYYLRALRAAEMKAWEAGRPLNE